MAGKPLVALINVVMDGDYQYEEEIPIGLGCLAAFLRREGYDVRVHQCFASQGEPAIAEAALVEADVYGFQLNMINYLSVQDVASRLKARKPDSFHMLGGPFLSSMAEEILERESVFDCMVYGEGELTMLEMLQQFEKGSLDVSAIQGVVWRNAEGKAVRNPPRALIPQLDSLPFPARDFIAHMHRDELDNGILGSLRIVTSRGCTANCHFCSVNFYTKLQKGKIWRGRSPQNVVDELEELVKVQGGRIFNLSDSSFEDPAGRVGKRRTREICDELIRRDVKLSLKVYMRADTMHAAEDEELLRLWKRAGIDVVIVGIEAGSDHELEFYGKKANVAMNEATLRRLKDMGLFYVIIGFMMFNPNSTMETLRTNIAFLRDMELVDNPNQITNSLMLIRDSHLYHVLKEENRVIEPANPWETPTYLFRDIRAQRAARHWDGLFGRFPLTLELNGHQVNFENLITRIQNPMNAPVAQAVARPFAELKEQYLALKQEFAKVQYDYFVRVLDLIEADCSDEVLDAEARNYFIGTYSHYSPRYQWLYETCMREMASTGLPLSGLTFKNFYSYAVNKGLLRVGKVGAPAPAPDVVRL
ncbi:MAG: B12-binding domain-containing radical SAM protein [Magnetococcales bacterium]|nr:B12-binding domain-containing radical SAM protein [Magnetococcales bacterium]